MKVGHCKGYSSDCMYSSALWWITSLNILFTLQHLIVTPWKTYAFVSELTPTQSSPTNSECGPRTLHPPPPTPRHPPKRRSFISDSNVTAPHTRDPETAASPRKFATPGTSCFDIFLNNVVRRLCYMQD